MPRRGNYTRRKKEEEKKRGGFMGLLEQGGDFGQAVIDRVGGGIVRGGIRLGAWLSEPLPGEQRKAAEDFIRKYAENKPAEDGPVNPFEYDEESTGGRAGRFLGTGIKAGTDIYGIGKVAGLGGKAAQAGSKAASIEGVASKASGFLGRSAGGSVGSAASQTAQGEDTNIGKELAVGALFDIGTGGIGLGLRKLGLTNETIKKLADEDNVDAIKKVLKDEVGDDVAEEVAPAIARTKDKSIISNLTDDGKSAIQKAEEAKNLADDVGRGTVDTVSGGAPGGTAYSTADEGFAKTFADAPGDTVTPRKVSLEDTLDTRNPEHRKQLESVLGKSKTKELIDRTDNGLPNHQIPGEQDELLGAAKKLGYKNVALSETDKLTKFEGRDVVSYASVDDAQPVLKTTPPARPGAVSKDADKVIDDYADMLKSMDDQATGGQLIGDATEGYKRTSEHSPFYREYFKEYGRAPSKAAWKEEAARQLEAGRASSEVQGYYDDLKNPEVTSLLQRADEGQYGDLPPVGEDVPVNRGKLGLDTKLEDGTVKPGEGRRQFGLYQTAEKSPKFTEQAKKRYCWYRSPDL